VIVNDLDDLHEKYPHHPKTAYVKKPKKGKAAEKEAAAEKKTKGKKGKAKKEKSAFSNQPAYKLSKELAAVVGVEELSRPDVIKKMWEYIKGNDLQDPKNKRRIVPDAKLAAVFGSKEPIDMMKLSGLIGKHLKKK
jgi:DNA topoisomerase-1